MFCNFFNCGSDFRKTIGFLAKSNGAFFYIWAGYVDFQHVNVRIRQTLHYLQIFFYCFSADIYDDFGIVLFKEGNITFNENIDAGILEADGIQHAAVNLRYTGSGVAGPGNVCHTFGNNGPKGAQIHKFTVFHAGAESP